MRGCGELRVGGFVPFTTVDFPGRLSAVVFCQGCPWRCRYCHNPHLQPWHGEVPWSWGRIREDLHDRRGFLEAVVFSGGEPTAQPGLLAAVQEVRELGFAVGLHTAGIFPERLEDVLPWVDWVGLDIKAPFDHRYDAVTMRPQSARPVVEALERILAAGVAVEVRTTVHPALLGRQDLDDLARGLASRGCRAPTLQGFRPGGCTDAELLAFPESSEG